MHQVGRVPLAIVLCLGLGLGRARAQDVSDDVRAEARDRFDRAVELYEEGLLAQALEEFRLVYEIAPTPQVLYNLGLVYAGLGRAVDAADTLRQYLNESGAEVSDSRRAEVEVEIRRQQARIATLYVHTSPPDAIVTVDGIERGPASGEGFRVTSGTIVVEVRAPGYLPFQAVLRLAGSVTETVDAVLEAIPTVTARIRVHAPDGATIILDGEEIGVAPLSNMLEVEEGRHVIESHIPGYASRSEEVNVLAAEQAEVTLVHSVRDLASTGTGRLSIRLPVAPTRVEVDGEDMGQATAFALPRGTHRLRVEVPEREPVRWQIEVAEGEQQVLTPVLQWTNLDERLEGNQALNIAGWTLLGIAAASGLATAIQFVVGVHGWTEGNLFSHEQALVMLSGGIVSALATTSGAIVLGSATSQQAVIHSASFQVSLGPRTLTLSGVF